MEGAFLLAFYSLQLRMDNGCQNTSDHFIIQIRCRGIAPSFGYPRESANNGVAEHFNRTLKKQIIYGMTEKLSDAYNNHWMLEKNGYLSPQL